MSYGYIYKLNFENLDQVYIGQSKVPNIRYTNHLASMRRGDAPKKLQDAFNKYGKPTMEILLECNSDEEMNSCENEAIGIFDSFNNGLNTKERSTSGGRGVFGDRNGNSKYSNEEIILLVEYILDNPKYTLSKVANICGFPLVVVEEVAGGVKHKWLSDAIPDKYNQLMSIRGTRSKAKSAKDRGITYPPIFSPDGTKYIVDNTREFSRLHELNCSCLGRVLRGLAKHHKGWSLNSPSINK